MYNLNWLEHWSEPRTPINPDVQVEHREESDGWFEHEYMYAFKSDNDEKAIEHAKDFVKRAEFTVDIFSLTDDDGNVILTEEGL